MKRLCSIISCILSLGLTPGRGGRCDIYVANAGSANCIFALFSSEEDPENYQKVLWVDCALGDRGSDVSSTCELDKAVKGFFFGGDSPSRGAGTQGIGAEDTMLWITHLHHDHIDNALQINGPCQGTDIKTNAEGESEKVNVGSIVVGVPGDVDTWSKDMGNLIDGILRHENVAKIQVLGGDWEASRDAIAAKVNDFWGNFPHSNIKLDPLIPSEEYGKGGEEEERGYREGEEEEERKEEERKYRITRRNDWDKLNDTSLVLRLEYYGVSVLFPGDAPGKMYGCLKEEDRSFVEDVDILIAPHHGSGGNHESVWYSSNKRFCTIISGDPGSKGVVLDLGSFGSRDGYGFARLGRPQNIYYSNPARKGATLKLKSQSRVPTLCTAGDRDSNENLVAYHISISDSVGNEDRIKLFRVLYSKSETGEMEYPEEEVKIMRAPD